MGTMSIWHWLVLLLLWLAFAIPLSRLGKRVGHPAWVGYLVCFPLLPFGSIIYLWLIAYSSKFGSNR
jgi:hypothetical protein